MQVNRERPLAKRDMRLVHRGAGFNREVASAIRTPIGHVVMAGLMRARAPAMRAVPTGRPYTGLEPFPGAFFGWEHVAKLHHRDAFAI